MKVVRSARYRIPSPRAVPRPAVGPSALVSGSQRPFTITFDRLHYERVSKQGILDLKASGFVMGRLGLSATIEA